MSGDEASAQGRPVIVEEFATIANPDASWQSFGRFVAIDGDGALVQVDRSVPDETSETGIRHDGAAMLFNRSGGTWTSTGLLGPVGVLTEWVDTGLAMKDGIAMVIEDTRRIFERTGTSWVQIPPTPSVPGRVQGPDIEIDSGRILVPQHSPIWASELYSKSGGVWRREATLTGHTSFSGDEPPTPSQDLRGNRAIIFNPTGSDGDPPVARLYQPNTTGTWEQFAVLSAPLGSTVFGPHAVLSGGYVAVSGSVEDGTWLWSDNGGTFGGPINVLQPADGYMQPGTLSTTTLEHSQRYILQRNFSHDRNAWVVNVFAEMNHVATLVGKNGASLGTSIDASGNRVIVGGRNGTTGDNIVRVFELPSGLPAWRELRQDDFEQSNAGADWQPEAGSAFSVVQSGNTRVYRQTSVAGNAASLLPASESADQAIQAEVTPTSFAGADRWFGLMTRQTDAMNYYYVTARSSGTIQLRRIVNGTFTTLASAPYSITANRKYRLRLESIGTMHRVYVDDKPLLTAHDSALSHGRSGVIMYRTSADYDNVLISPSSFTTIYAQSFSGSAGRWKNLGQGAWFAENGVYRQASTVDGTRSLTGASTNDHVVQVRVRPTAFNGADRWVGLLARYENDSNYIYVTLRSSNVLSLRRLSFGQIEVLEEQPLTVTPNTWYTLRLEKIGNKVRVYVNETLRISAEDNVGLPGGRVGLLTYKAAADFDDFIAYQP
jgi:hypothetical protein